jgi:hypothetical protein
MFNVQSGAAPILWVHIPFLCWTGDFAAAFEAFHQVFFTSLGGGSRTLDMEDGASRMVTPFGWGCSSFGVSAIPMSNHADCRGWTIHF